ncbi:MAG: adenosylmethionine decarboxylase, partial [Alphaproteobacteria bacterium]|nr:adenosylmethionine decarboxylase [Alphaproteobacteria bacterium]
SGATILHGHFHHFSPNGGVSGVLVLAESHVSIHTWPEKNFAALDIFVCGACDPYKAIAHLKTGFLPERVQLNEQRRGVIV